MWRVESADMRSVESYVWETSFRSVYLKGEMAHLSTPSPTLDTSPILLPHLSVLRDSSKLMSAGLTHAIMTVRLLPPKLS